MSQYNTNKDSKCLAVRQPFFLGLWLLLKTTIWPCLSNRIHATTSLLHNREPRNVPFPFHAPPTTTMRACLSSNEVSLEFEMVKNQRPDVSQEPNTSHNFTVGKPSVNRCPFPAPQNRKQTLKVPGRRNVVSLPSMIIEIEHSDVKFNEKRNFPTQSNKAVNHPSKHPREVP